MKSFAYKLFSVTKRVLWTILVTFMIGLHNFYKGDNQTIESIGKSKTPTEIQADGASKD